MASNDSVLSDAEKDPTTPEFKHRKKLLDQEKKRKARNKVEESWVELVPNKLSKKGGKVSVVQRTSNGNVHREFVGHEKQCAVYLAKAKKENKLR